MGDWHTLEIWRLIRKPMPGTKKTFKHVWECQYWRSTNPGYKRPPEFDENISKEKKSWRSSDDPKLEKNWEWFVGTGDCAVVFRHYDNPKMCNKTKHNRKHGLDFVTQNRVRAKAAGSPGPWGTTRRLVQPRSESTFDKALTGNFQGDPWDVFGG
jgi:hypothetical protein